MLGKGLRLYKREKLCSHTAIERLFSSHPRKNSLVTDRAGVVGVELSYPLRMVYGENKKRGGAPVQFLISVPKKRLRHAVDRVTMRRRVREAYRIVRGDVDRVVPGDTCYDVAFIYVADSRVDFDRVLKAMRKLMETLNTRLYGEK